MFSIKDFFSKCDQNRSFLRISSHLLKKSLMENFIFCAMICTTSNTKISPNFLVRKFCRKEKFRASFYAFPPNFHTTNFAKTLVFYTQRMRILLGIYMLKVNIKNTLLWCLHYITLCHFGQFFINSERIILNVNLVSLIYKKCLPELLLQIWYLYKFHIYIIYIYICIYIIYM